MKHFSFLTHSLLATALLFLGFSVQSKQSQQTSHMKFFESIKSLCGTRFEGYSSFPEDPGDAFRDQLLVASISSCGDTQIRIPFQVGADTSRTWVLSLVDDGIELKHDHRHADGTPDEVSMYGGTTAQAGSELSQSFPADDYTAELIPDAATNEWFLTLSEDGKKLTYYLERHAKPRFKAKLNRISKQE
ncbi:MAG: hypothetical protein ACI9H8_000288 [Lysobacterales bacterium]|jgi:hypothetical protein